MIKAIIFDYYRTLYDPEEGISLATENLVRELKEQGVILALITRNESAKRDISSNLFFSFFSVVKTVEDDKKEEDFREVMKQINVKGEEILVVGDRIKKEIVIGNKIGLKTVWLKKGLYAKELPETKAEEPWKIIEDLQEIKQFVQGALNNSIFASNSKRL